MSIPPAEAYGVVSFYARFALEPRDAEAVHVCDDIVCMLAGAKADHGAPCLGMCDRAPATLVERAGESYEAVQSEGTQHAVGQKLLRRVGVVDPESLDSYRAHGGFAALKRARDIGGPAVIQALNDAKLLGRGGAAFSMGRKWGVVNLNDGQPHYLCANADEGEPGTFKDRWILEEAPHLLLESKAWIAAFVTSCEKGYVYVRTEVPACARASGECDRGVSRRRSSRHRHRGAPRRRRLHLRRGDGVFNSIEGKRESRATSRRFRSDVGPSKSQLVNNVETLVNVLDIINGEFGDTRLFCVSGHVSHPGVYELPLGTPLRDLLEMAGARQIQAVLLGGAAGSFLTPEQPRRASELRRHPGDRRHARFGVGDRLRRDGGT
jgi:NADH-quinone oxidoreductase subunit F